MKQTDSSDQNPEFDAELTKVRTRYSRRDAMTDKRYAPLAPATLRTVQEKERAIASLLKRAGFADTSRCRALEIGCGSGGNLLSLLRLGFLPENLIGNELLPQRAAMARQFLPSAIDVMEGNALQLDFMDEYFDIVYQSTVFSSILDEEFQIQLASRMWSLVRPGGGILWYDLACNNPSNPDVRKISRRDLHKLFPEAKVAIQRVTLAPPISRRACYIWDGFYPLLNSLPLLRTHLIAWLGKSSESPPQASTGTHNAR